MVQFNRKKPNGNIYWILGAAVAELKRDGKEDDAQRMCDRVYQSGSYDTALAIIGEYVELVEVRRG
jgi:hypothetical protein